ncbi:MAG: helix-turn-helix transcriptional regulator [Lachnospira sp.]|nr:helix-turn-helix transcriptional regulator [Lachnospira sp.]
MELDYNLIGQRIKMYRKYRRLSQEQLAEKVNISIPHMSHIETANTKLSLQVFIDIADALCVRTDTLLQDSLPDSDNTKSDIIALLDTCTPEQLLILHDIISATKFSFDKHIYNK